MITLFDQSRYDESEWPRLWRLEGLVNTVLEAHRFRLAAMPLHLFVAFLYRRVLAEARRSPGVPLEQGWVCRVLLREYIQLKRAIMERN